MIIVFFYFIVRVINSLVDLFQSQYIREMNLGGAMIWALDLDDFKNRCGEGRHPLLTTIAKVLAPPPGMFN